MTWLSRSCIAAGLAGWTVWLSWRLTTPPRDPLAAVELALELAAALAALVISVALWSHQRTANPFASTGGRVDVSRLATSLDVDIAQRTHGDDDTGEVAVARRSLALLVPGGCRRRITDRIGAAAAVLALEGIRRMCLVIVLVAVLLTGRFPFPTPPRPLLAVLVGAQAMLALGHWLAGRRTVRLGERAVWAMRTVGAGIGDGKSRTGLPIRWATTMGTIVVVNLAMALRGFSDRWTHGLGSLEHDERVISMAVAWWVVATGFIALRQLPQPSYAEAPAGRHEESSSRRLALGGTLAVAVVGCVAGVLPGVVPT